MVTGEAPLPVSASPMRLPLTASEPMSLAALMVALWVSAPLLASMPAMIEPPMVTLAIRLPVEMTPE